MEKNVFYLIIGCVALILLAIFWYSVENYTSVFFMAAFVICAVVIYLSYRRVSDFAEDERSAKITEKASLRTLQVFWVCFCAFSLGAVMNLLYVPRIPRDHWFERPVESFAIISPRVIGYVQLGLLCLMIFLYVGFRMYYARKYGDWESDEE